MHYEIHNKITGERYEIKGIKKKATEALDQLIENRLQSYRENLKLKYSLVRCVDTDAIAHDLCDKKTGEIIRTYANRQSAQKDRRWQERKRGGTEIIIKKSEKK